MPIRLFPDGHKTRLSAEWKNRWMKRNFRFLLLFFPSESKKTPFCVWITSIHMRNSTAYVKIYAHLCDSIHYACMLIWFVDCQASPHLALTQEKPRSIWVFFVFFSLPTNPSVFLDSFYEDFSPGWLSYGSFLKESASSFKTYTVEEEKRTRKRDRREKEADREREKVHESKRRETITPYAQRSFGNVL